MSKNSREPQGMRRRVSDPTIKNCHKYDHVCGLWVNCIVVVLADDRNPTVNELISQRGILQKATGWKLYYVSAQVEDVVSTLH